MTTYTATYSPDDNKLRLYATSRLDAETYERAKALGFRWAPKQEHFFATWNPSAEDFLIELAGDIEDEDKSLTERAEERAERFEGYEENRTRDADQAHAAVAAIADNIPLGQPILIGHHSEKHARKDAERIENGMRRALKMWDTAKYWKSRAAGAIAHAKYKERPDVRHRRIKTIEAEKRKRERSRQEAQDRLKLWTKDGLTLDQARTLANFGHGGPNVFHREGGKACDWWNAYDVLQPDETRYKACPAGTVEQCQEAARRAYPPIIAHCERWIAHYDNRLEYERAMLQEAGGIAAEKFDIQVGGRIRFRGEWGTVLKVIKRGGEVLSVKTNARGWGTVGIEEIREYEPPDTETAAKVQAAMKLPPLCNYPGEGFTHLTRAELDARPERKWSDFPKIGIIKATETHGAHRVQMCRGATQWSRVPAYVTDEKRKDPPAKDPSAPVIEPPRRAWDPQLEAEAHAEVKHPDERAQKFAQLKATADAGVQVVNAPQLFPTPPELAARMVELAEIPAGARVLEPSAGTGNILSAIAARKSREEKPCHVEAVEINATLARSLEPLANVTCADFLSWNNAEGFDRIIMNPPFVNAADIAHIRHALTMLRPGGRLVALCANGPRQRTDLQPIALSWEDLPAGTFAAEGTGVNVALVIIEKDGPSIRQDPPKTAAPDPEVRHRSEVEAPHFALQIQAGAIPAACGPQGDMFGAQGLDRLPPPKFRNPTTGGLFS